MLGLALKRCQDTDSELLAIYPTNLTLHLPGVSSTAPGEYIAIYSPPALLTCTERLTRSAFDGCLPSDFAQSLLYSPPSKSTSQFWRIAKFVEFNPDKLPVKVDGEEDNGQKYSLRYVEVKEVVKLAMGGTCDMIDLLRIAAVRRNHDFEEKSSPVVQFESDKWKLLVSTVISPFIDQFLNLQWVRRTFGFACGTIKSLKYGPRAPDDVRFRLFAMIFHRFFNVFEFLRSKDWTVQREKVASSILSTQEFLSSLNSLDSWMDAVLSSTSPIAELLVDIQDGKFAEDSLFETLEKSMQDTDDLIKKILKKKGAVNEKLARFNKSSHNLPEQFGKDFDSWLRSYRPRLANDLSVEADVAQLKQCPENVKDILKFLNCPIQPCQVMFLTQSGSYLYDLATSSSDKDYMIVFSHFPSMLNLASTPAPELYEDHSTYQADKSDVVEYSANEIDNFCVMIMKGNPRNLEPLYASESKITFESVLWKKFKSFRSSLLSRRVFAQYLGFVNDRIMKAKKEYDRQDYNRCAKYLYHANHKLYDVLRLAEGEVPKVTLDGEEKEKIMAIRTVCKRPESTPEFLQEFLGRQIEETSSLLEIAAKKGDSTDLPAEADFEKLFEFLSFVRFVYQTIE